MKKGWYKETPISLMIKSAKIWASEMGFTGEEHRDEVRRLVLLSLEH